MVKIAVTHYSDNHKYYLSGTYDASVAYTWVMKLNRISTTSFYSIESINES